MSAMSELDLELRAAGIDPETVRFGPTGRRCVCVTHTDGSTTTMLCPVHADTDPCLTMATVTGRRRTGTIRRGVCTSCGHGSAPAQQVTRHREYRGVIIEPRNVFGMYSARVDVPGGGVRVAADTLAGIRAAIRDALEVTR